MLVTNKVYTRVCTIKFIPNQIIIFGMKHQISIQFFMRAFFFSFLQKVAWMAKANVSGFQTMNFSTNSTLSFHLKSHLCIRQCIQTFFLISPQNICSVHFTDASEMLLLSSHDICFHGERRKTFDTLNRNPLMIYVSFVAWAQHAHSCSLIRVYADHTTIPFLQKKKKILFLCKCAQRKWKMVVYTPGTQFHAISLTFTGVKS